MCAEPAAIHARSVSEAAQPGGFDEAERFVRRAHIIVNQRIGRELGTPFPVRARPCSRDERTPGMLADSQPGILLRSA